jgi:hypothetical protein
LIPRVLFVAAAVLATLASFDAAAAPRLYCHIEQGGTTRDLQFSASSNPYTAPSTAINNRFRFKAVMVGDGQHVDYIKLYTYYQTRRQAMLLHEVKYLAPRVELNAQAGRDAASLTGIVYLYSPLLGREIVYSCALREDAA